MGHICSRASEHTHMQVYGEQDAVEDAIVEVVRACMTTMMSASMTVERRCATMMVVRVRRSALTACAALPTGVNHQSEDSLANTIPRHSVSVCP